MPKIFLKKIKKSTLTLSFSKSPACLSEQARPKQKYEIYAQNKGNEKRENEGKICRIIAKKSKSMCILLGSSTPAL